MRKPAAAAAAAGEVLGCLGKAFFGLRAPKVFFLPLPLAFAHFLASFRRNAPWIFPAAPDRRISHSFSLHSADLIRMSPLPRRSLGC